MAQKNKKPLAFYHGVVPVSMGKCDFGKYFNNIELKSWVSRQCVRQHLKEHGVHPVAAIKGLRYAGSDSQKTHMKDFTKDTTNNHGACLGKVRRWSVSIYSI